MIRYLPAHACGALVKPVIDRFEAVDDEIAASLRGMGPAKRLALVFQAEWFVRNLMRAGDGTGTRSGTRRTSKKK